MIFKNTNYKTNIIPYLALLAFNRMIEEQKEVISLYLYNCLLLRIALKDDDSCSETSNTDDSMNVYILIVYAYGVSVARTIPPICSKISAASPQDSSY